VNQCRGFIYFVFVQSVIVFVGQTLTMASTLFGNNVTNFLLSMGDSKQGQFQIRHDDEAVRGALVTQGGEVGLALFTHVILHSQNTN
jgi:hypothetical protein